MTIPKIGVASNTELYYRIDVSDGAETTEGESYCSGLGRTCEDGWKCQRCDGTGWCKVTTYHIAPNYYDSGHTGVQNCGDVGWKMYEMRCDGCNESIGAYKTCNKGCPVSINRIVWGEHTCGTPQGTEPADDHKRVCPHDKYEKHYYCVHDHIGQHKVSI